MNHYYNSITIVLFIISILLSSCGSPAELTPPIPGTTSLSPTSTLNTELTGVTQSTSYGLTPSFTPAQPTPRGTATPLLPANTQATTLAPAATSTYDYAPFVDAWSTYTNDEFGFSFEYPTIYDQLPSSCGVKVFTSNQWIFYLAFGHRSELAIATNDLSALSDYIDRWIQTMSERGDWSLSSRYGRAINGSQTVTIEYRFSFRSGTTTFFEQQNTIYIFNWTAGGGCDVPEIQLNEYYAYNHAVESFKIEAHK